MKELTIEQKAKAYDEAIKRAKELLEIGVKDTRDKMVVLSFFPELKESEDKKIKKEIISHLKYLGKYCQESMPNVNEWITWIEKQGDKKPINKVEPKFHKDDWIVHTGTENIYQIVAIIDDKYQLKYGDNYVIEKYTDVDICSRLWTIQDAKDGDVLADDEGFVCIFKKLNKEGFDMETYCHLFKNGLFDEGGLYIDVQGCHPATKEQRDTLMKAMADAGYTFEKKELKKIGQNPAWSEEDEENFRSVYLDVKSARQNTVNSLSGELKEQEQKRMDEVISWLKSLKDRVGCEVNYTTKKEWSEDDEKMCQETIDWFEKKCFPYALESENPARESIKWLKSLKDKYAGKPSDEQIKVCKEVYADLLSAKGFNVGTINSELNRLEEQLKKLKNKVMKAKEAPEKLYLIQHNGLICYCRNNNDDIEYTRTDVFIEKACEYWYKYNRDVVSGFTVDVERFKKYMKGENE